MLNRSDTETVAEVPHGSLPSPMLGTEVSNFGLHSFSPSPSGEGVGVRKRAQRAHAGGRGFEAKSTRAARASASPAGERQQRAGRCIRPLAGQQLGSVPMLQVEFITCESEGDLIVSFAIAPSAYRSLTLHRSPQYEHLLPEEERGARSGRSIRQRSSRTSLSRSSGLVGESSSRRNGTSTNSTFQPCPRTSLPRPKPFFE